MRRDPHRWHQLGEVRRWLRDLAVLSFASTVLTACVFLPSDVEPPPAVEPQAAAVETAPAPAPAPARPESPPPVAEPQRWAIVLSQEIPAFREIADEITRRLGSERVDVYNLDGRTANGQRVTAALADTHPDRLIAIGLLAATVVKRTPDAPMVFCQVYNYGDHELISANSKGVSLLPPFGPQLDAWKALSPELSHVGVITGPGQEPLIDEIRNAATEHGVELSVRTVLTDQEALYEFKDITPDIQGLWLLPDNRILSPEVVREIMVYAGKHRRQVVVFGSNLLGLGALMSVESDAADVADRVLARFDSLQSNHELGDPDMLSLTEMRLRINRDVASRLGLVVPEHMANAAASDR